MQIVDTSLCVRSCRKDGLFIITLRASGPNTPRDLREARALSAGLRTGTLHLARPPVLAGIPSLARGGDPLGVFLQQRQFARVKELIEHAQSQFAADSLSDQRVFKQIIGLQRLYLAAAVRGRNA
jgi:hypothetical protein